MKIILLALFALCLCTGISRAASPPVAHGTGKQCFHLNATSEQDIGYCQAIRIGNTLYISGSVGAGEMPAAVHKSYDTIKKTLAAHGLDFSNIVSESVYTTDLDAFIKNKDVRREYYGSDLPAATWVQVQRLFLPAFVVEVQVTAVFPQ